MKHSRFLDLALGTQDVLLFAMCLVFALIGVVIILLIKSGKRNKESEATPEKFSYKFLFIDNFKEIFLGFLLILMALRFSVEYGGVELTVWYSFVIGLSSQKLATWASKLEDTARK